ncbi:hypothetical protein MHU86_4924 [Fragilaria crotonensis]|nr:hypothetical protein MHU86_4924 [Fragilaria crotonensis]
MAEPSGAAQIIAYAVSITGFGSDPLSEGAAVLKHVIHLMSVPGNPKARYDYRNVRHRSSRCSIVWYDAIIVGLCDNETRFASGSKRYSRRVLAFGEERCLGEKDLFKLEACTLVDHPVVARLDLDTLVQKPLDDLFDIMLGKAADTSA